MEPIQSTTGRPQEDHRTATAERVVTHFLCDFLGSEPRKTSVVVSGNMILVRAFQPFPEAEATVLSGHTNDALYHEYYSRLFRASSGILKQDLGRSLQCEIQHVEHILNADAQELDIVITLNHSHLNTLHNLEEYKQ